MEKSLRGDLDRVDRTTNPADFVRYLDLTRATIAAVVLAAGTSSRMGSMKLLLPLGDRPVIARVVTAALASSATPVAVVLGHEAAAVRAALPHGRWEAVINQEYASGMASSLRAGIAWLEARPAEARVRGALILLGDQPLITTAMIEQMLARARERPDHMCAASYAGERRHPVYFPRALFDELRGLTGDEGGRAILARHRDRLDLVPLSPAEAALDVDTPEDYARVRVYWNGRSGSVDG